MEYCFIACPLSILTVIPSPVQLFTPFCKFRCVHASPVFQFLCAGFSPHTCDSCFIADLLHVKMHVEFTTPVYIARSASCCWQWRASCSSTAWRRSEVCNNIHRGKDTVEAMSTMNEGALVRSILRRRDAVGVVVSGMRGMRGSSLAVRRRWKGVNMKAIEWSMFPSCWILSNMTEMKSKWDWCTENA